MSVKNLPKGGAGWKYNDSDINYDSETEPKSGLAVKYNSLGSTPVVTNLTKHAA